MAITLGTNITSLGAQMNLGKTTNIITKTMQRLYTGSKINSASDDASGLVISENMEALIQASKQAQSNIQTASSFLTIAEDGMISISDHFQRINDLLVNMANGTNDTYSANAAVQEIIERLNEISRLAKSVNFNGKMILDGTALPLVVQMGSDSTELSTLDISNALTDCRVEAFGVELPGNLNPDSYKDENGKIIIPNADNTGYIYEEDGSEYNGDVSTLESGFDPSNENCRAYLEKIQNAISTIASKRGLLGAYENRMESAYDSMSARILSLESAKSVYKDTDVAQEASNLIQKQIMEQINVSILASANTMQQTALALLGG